MSSLRSAIALGVALLVVIFAACGADQQVAPAPFEPNLAECRDFELLMPAFLRIVREGRTETLRQLVEDKLLVSPREGVPPAMNDVLRAIFKTLERLASRPPEVGAPAGEFCAPTTSPPPLAQSNELCELRRSLDVLVHQGRGIDAVNLIEPQLELFLRYVTGEGVECNSSRPRAAHYEVAGLISSFCTQTEQCQLVDGLDTVIAFADYFPTPDGRLLAQHLTELVQKPSIRALVDPVSATSLSENDMVAIARALIPAIANANAADLRNAFDQLPLPQEVKTDLQPVVADLEKLVVRQDLMAPVRRSLNCFTVKDRNLDLIRMVYRLGIAEECEAFGLTRLTGIIQDLQRVDERGSIVFLAGTLAAAVRADELAIDSAAQVCRDLFSTARLPGEARSNAELAMPVASEMVQAGIINEAVCAMDTMLFGCAGGAQPACNLP